MKTVRLPGNLADAQVINRNRSISHALMRCTIVVL